MVYIYILTLGGILMVNVTIYSSTMDPMGYKIRKQTDVKSQMIRFWIAVLPIERVEQIQKTTTHSCLLNNHGGWVFNQRAAQTFSSYALMWKPGLRGFDELFHWETRGVMHDSALCYSVLLPYLPQRSLPMPPNMFNDVHVFLSYLRWYLYPVDGDMGADLGGRNHR